MAQPARRLLYWAPRVLGVLFIVFTGVLALDVFDLGYGLWGTVLALLIHLIPTALLAAALAVAWRWEWAGAAIFGGLGLLFVGMGIAAVAVGSLPVFLNPLVVPLLLIGALFLAAWRWGRPSAASQ